MPIKLKSRELPAVQFRRVLPEWLGPGTEEKPVECYLKFEARAGGPINQRHVELAEKAVTNARIMARKASRVEDDAEFIRLDEENADHLNRLRFAAMYNACVISWESNILTEDDDGKMVGITCDRETFLALTEVNVPEIGKALADFEKAIIKAGKAQTAEDDSTVKN